MTRHFCDECTKEIPKVYRLKVVVHDLAYFNVGEALAHRDVGECCRKALKDRLLDALEKRR